MLSEEKIKDILFKLNMLGFEEEYDEKKDNLKSYLKGRRDAFNFIIFRGNMICIILVLPIEPYKYMEKRESQNCYG
jgi:hypothetical protein